MLHRLPGGRPVAAWVVVSGNMRRRVRPPRRRIPGRGAAGRWLPATRCRPDSRWGRCVIHVVGFWRRQAGPRHGPAHGVRAARGQAAPHCRRPGRSPPSPKGWAVYDQVPERRHGICEHSARPHPPALFAERPRPEPGRPSTTEAPAPFRELLAKGTTCGLGLPTGRPPGRGGTSWPPAPSLVSSRMNGGPGTRTIPRKSTTLSAIPYAVPGTTRPPRPAAPGHTGFRPPWRSPQS